MKTYDICVIGTGPAGAFAAHELAHSGFDVVVVEAGDTCVNSSRSLYLDESCGGVSGEIDYGFSQQVGGASNLWAGGLAKFDQIDFEARANTEFDGWPIAFSEVESYYKRVDSIISLMVGNDERVATEADSLAKSEIEPREMMVLSEPYNTRVLVQNQHRIDLRTRLSAVRLLLDPEGRTSVYKLQCFDHQTKTVVEIASRQYILAAGTLSNVRIILHSFRGSDSTMIHGIMNVGKFLSTHPKAEVGKLELNRKIGPDHPFIIREHYSSHLSRYQFGLKPGRLIKDDLLNHCVRFDSRIVNRLSRLFEASSSMLASHKVSQSGLTARLLASFGIRIFRTLETTALTFPFSQTLNVRGFFDQYPRRENRIELSDKQSETGLPLACIYWEFNEQDWDSVDRFMLVLEKEIEALGIGKFTYKRPTLTKFTGIHSHYIGGLRMGLDPMTSVVDRHLRIHGLSNLYVSGPSVFPSYGYANPFYTIAALSLRLADTLSRITSPSGNGVNN